jgi:hypothetical protein
LGNAVRAIYDAFYGIAWRCSGWRLASPWCWRFDGTTAAGGLAGKAELITGV